MNNMADLFKGDPCAYCHRLPVKSRRNTLCHACGAIVCIRCQMAHFEEKHGDA